MQLQFQRHDLALAHQWQIAGSDKKAVQSVLIGSLRDEAVAGLGEAAPSRRYGETVETALAFLKKVDPPKLSFADIPGSMRYLDTVAPGECSAKGALNIALLDGAAKLAVKPLHDFLGLSFTEGRHITSFTIGLDTPEMVEKKVAAAASRFSVLKLKVGGPNDRENLAALRRAAPQERVRLDANEAWNTKEHALEMIEWFAGQGNIELIEQPMPAGTPLADLRWLKERSPLRLFADEPFHSAGDVEFCAQGYHGVNVKLHKTGGVTGALNALRAAKRAGLQTMLGCMIESSVLISAAAHLADLADFLDLDGNLLITNDPFRGVTFKNGVLSFASAAEPFGLRVTQT